MDKQAIKQSIVDRVESASLSDAQDIESFFINKKGMKGRTGGDLNARRTAYAYIF